MESFDKEQKTNCDTYSCKQRYMIDANDIVAFSALSTISYAVTYFWFENELAKSSALKKLADNIFQNASFIHEIRTAAALVVILAFAYTCIITCVFELINSQKTTKLKSVINSLLKKYNSFALKLASCVVLVSLLISILQHPKCSLFLFSACFIYLTGICSKNMSIVLQFVFVYY